jgi:uncharacterized membrane protein YbhN (UPF0104 family)
VTAVKKIWSTGWRVAVGAVLLLWIFHSIFVNEAREQSKCKDPAQCAPLVDRGQTIDYAQWQTLARTEQWRLGWTYGPPALGQTLQSVHPGALALSFLLMGGTLLIGVLRWRMVLHVQGFQLPFGRAAEISLVAHFFNSFLLGTVGGDVMKAYCAARETHHKKTEAVMTVFMDRVIGLWSMLVFATIMLVPNLRLFERLGLRRAFLRIFSEPSAGFSEFFHIVSKEPIVTATAVLLGMTLVSTAFVFLAFRGGVSKRWSGARDWLRRLPKGDAIERSLESCRKFGQERSFFIRALGLSMLLNFLCVLQFWVLSRGLNMNVPLLALSLVVPTVICLAALPIAPSGLGVREYLFVQLLSAAVAGVDPTSALSLSLLAFAGSLFWSLVGGAVYAMFKHKHHLDDFRDEVEEGESSKLQDPSSR